MSEKPRTKSRYSAARGAALGFFVGMLIPCVYLSPAFVERVLLALKGGGGESADWGEPLAYMFFLGIPGGLMGAIAGAFLVAVICWIVHRK